MAGRARTIVTGAGPSANRDPRKEGAECDRCPLRGCEGPVFGYGPRTAEIAFVGEGPGLNEVQFGIPFVGRSGDLLDQFLRDLGLNKNAVYIDNATLEFPRGGSLKDFLKFKKKELKEAGMADQWVDPVDACRPRLFRALGIPRCKSCARWQYGPPEHTCRCERPFWIKPPNGLVAVKSIIPLGNFALQSLLGLEGIQKWRGSPISWADFSQRKNFFAFAGGVVGGSGSGAAVKEETPEDDE